MFKMTKEYIDSFAAPTHDDVRGYNDVTAKAFKHKNGKWYVTCAKKNGACVLDAYGNYYVFAEITPDAKFIAPAGKTVVNDDTIVQVKELPDFRCFNMNDKRRIYVSANENGEYVFDKEHIIGTLYPECK
jgi:hypothetical protein